MRIEVNTIRINIKDCDQMRQNIAEEVKEYVYLGTSVSNKIKEVNYIIWKHIKM